MVHWMTSLIFSLTSNPDWTGELFDFASSPAGILAFSVLTFLALIVLVLGTLSVRRRAFHRRILKDIEKEFDIINQIPIEDRLNKIATIGNLNSVFMHAHRDFSARYQEVQVSQGEEIKKDIETFRVILQEKDYKKSLTHSNQIRVKLSLYRDSFNELFTNLSEITRGEGENLKELKLIQTTYDTCRSLFMGHPEHYEVLAAEFNQLFVQIDDKKEMIDSHLRTGDYVDAKEVLVTMKNDVNSLHYFLTTMPKVIKQFHIDIPQKINDLIDRFEIMKSEEFPLSHIRFTAFVEQIKLELANIYKRMKGFQLNGLEENYASFEKQIIEMKQHFDDEVKARSIYDAKCNEVNDQALQFESQFFNRFTRELREIKDVFELDGPLQTLIKELHEEINRMSQLRRYLDNSIYSLQPFSLRILRMDDLAKQVAIVQTKIDLYHQQTNQMRVNSEAAFDRVEQGLITLKTIELDIRMLKIFPTLEHFHDLLNEANLQIQNLDRCLKTIPIQIPLMNQLVAVLDTNLSSLKEIAKKTKDNAAYAEDLILFGNRFRSSFQEVELSVVTAESAYLAGDFEHSVQTLKASLARFNLPTTLRN